MNTNKILEHAISILILLSFALSGCAAVQGVDQVPPILDGRIEPVGYNAVVRYVYEIYRERMLADSIIMVNDAKNLVTFGFRHAGGWAYICISGSTVNLCNALNEIGGKGTAMNRADFRTIMDAAEKLGWRPIAPSDLPKLYPALSAAIEATSGAVRGIMPTIPIFPVFPILEYNPWQSGQS